MIITGPSRKIAGLNIIILRFYIKNYIRKFITITRLIKVIIIVTPLKNKKVKPDSFFILFNTVKSFFSIDLYIADLSSQNDLQEHSAERFTIYRIS